jgi:tetratricopeptide (TPR) repeat protein
LSAKRKRKRWAFLVGIGSYDEKAIFQPLPYVDSNIKALNDILVKQYSFDKENIQILSSEREPRPTENKILREFSKFMRRTKHKDIVLIYIMGHGCSYRGRNYLFAYDSFFEKDDLSTISDSALHLDKFDEIIEANNYNTRNILLIVDACKERITMTAGVTSPLESFTYPKKPTGLTKFFSCSSGEYSHTFQQKELLQSIFTHYVIEGLANDIPSPLKIGDLVEYVNEKVATLAHVEGVKQTPILLTSNEDVKEIILGERMSPRSTEAPTHTKMEGETIGKVGLTIKESNEVLTVSPEDVPALTNLGLSYFLKGDFEQAITHYKKVLVVEPQNVDVLTNIARTYYLKGEYDLAIMHYATLIAIKPDDFMTQYGLGLVYLKKNEIDPALNHFKLALEINPRYAVAHANLGQIYYYKNEFDLAIKHLKKVLEINPKYTEIDMLLGDVQTQRDLLKLDKQILVAEFSEIDSLDFIKMIIRRFSTDKTAEGKKIVIAKDSVSIRLKTVERLLRRSIINLLKNALEASSKDEKVIIGCDKDEDEIVFWVKNKVVLSEKIRSQIFKRFFSSKGIGRGLGTYTVKVLIEEHLNGRVNFESTEKTGTIFRIYLPLETI